MVCIDLRSIDKDDHLTNDPPTDETRQEWLRNKTKLLLQIHNSIDSEISALINHCEFVKKKLMEYLDFCIPRKEIHIYKLKWECGKIMKINPPNTGI